MAPSPIYRSKLRAAVTRGARVQAALHDPIDALLPELANGGLKAIDGGPRLNGAAAAQHHGVAFDVPRPARLW